MNLTAKNTGYFLMHLGDLTLTTPFIHALRKAAPDSHIAMLVDEKLKDVVLFQSLS